VACLDISEPSPVASVVADDVTHVRGDVTDPASLEGVAEGCDAAIHLVGIISELGDLTYDRVHREGTVNVVEAAKKAGVKRFILMSALGARADAVSRYHQSRWAAEEVVRNSGLDYTIFRPSVIYGPGDQFVNMFVRFCRYSPVLPVIGSGKSKLQPIPVEAVAQSFVRAISAPGSTGQTYDLCGLEVLTLEQILDQILEVMGQERWKWHVPLNLMQWQAQACEWVFPNLFNKPPPLNQDQLIMLQEDNTGDPEPAVETFHLELPTFKEGISRYLR
jgi:NADH dehydrogenase